MPRRSHTIPAPESAALDYARGFQDALCAFFGILDVAVLPVLQTVVRNTPALKAGIAALLGDLVMGIQAPKGV